MNQHPLTVSRHTSLIFTVMLIFAISPPAHSESDVSNRAAVVQNAQASASVQSAAPDILAVQHATQQVTTPRRAMPSSAPQSSGNIILYILLLLLAITLIIATIYVRVLLKAEARARHLQKNNTPANAPQVNSTAQAQQHENAQVISPTVVPEATRTDPASPIEKSIEVITPVITTSADDHKQRTPTPKTVSHHNNHNDKVSAEVEQYLRDFAHDQLRQTMIHSAELKYSQLDYSAASLSRIDQFLIELRHKNTLHIRDFSTRDDHRTLLIFLAFYVATTIARITQQTIRWYDYAGLKIYLKNPTMLASLHNSYSCVLGRNSHFMPIELIASILFEPQSKRRCSDQLNHAQQHAQPYAPILRSSQQTVINADTEQERAWVAAMKLAGQIAAKSVYQRQSGALIPMLMYPKNRVQVVTESLIGDDPSDFFDRMKDNPHHLAYQAMAHDSSAYLPTGMCDALIITARCYGMHAAEWTVILPYHSAQSADDIPRNFAIFTPLLAPSTIASYYNSLFMQAFYSGVSMINLPGDPWHSNLQEA